MRRKIQTLEELVPSLRARADRVALIALEHKQRQDWGAAPLAEQALRLAAALRGEGLATGARVLLYAPNSPHWIIACLAIIGARGVPVPVDNQIGERDLAHIAENSGARWAFTTTRLAKTLQQFAATPPQILLLDGDADDDRDGSDSGDNDAAAAALERDCMLIWFPEGRRSPDGQLQPFRSGIGSLALAQDVPILPVHIQGTREALPPGSLRLRLRPVALRVGAPVRAKTLMQEGQGDNDAERIANALQARVRALGADFGDA